MSRALAVSLRLGPWSGCSRSGPALDAGLDHGEPGAARDLLEEEFDEGSWALDPGAAGPRKNAATRGE